MQEVFNISNFIENKLYLERCGLLNLGSFFLIANLYIRTFFLLPTKPILSKHVKYTVDCITIIMRE